MNARLAGLTLLAAVFCVGCGGEKPLAEFHSAAGKFKVMFPGTPKQLSTKGRNNITANVFTVESGSWAYIITYYDSPAPIPQDEATIRMLLPAEVNGVFQGMNGTKQSQDFIKLQEKYEGVQFAGSVTKPLQGQLRGRSYIVGNRVYNMFVLGSAEKVNGEVANGFLNSFKVEP